MLELHTYSGNRHPGQVWNLAKGQHNEKVSAITGRSMEQVSEEIRRDKHFTPEEALDYGIIDKVLYRPRTGAR